MSDTSFRRLTDNQKFYAALIFAYVVVVTYICRNLFFMAMWGGPAHQDIATYYVAAKAAFQAVVSPYTAEALQNFKPAGLAIVYPFLYPPSALPFFWPLSHTDFGTARLIMLGLNTVMITALVAGMSLWTLRLTGSLWAAILMVPVLTEGSHGLWATLWYGQINAGIALLLLGVMGCLYCKKALPAGVLLGIAVTLKVYPAILLPWLALRRDWKTLGYTLGTLFVFVALALFWLPTYMWSDWMSKVVAFGYGTQPPGLIAASHHSNLNINGVLMRSLTDTGLIKFLAYGSALLLTAITFFVAHKRPEQMVGNLAALMWLTLLVAPLTWLSQLTYVLFVPVWFLCMAWNRRQYVWGAVFVVIYTFILQVTQVDVVPPLWQSNLPCLGLLILWGMIEWQLWHTPAAAKTSATQISATAAG